MSYFSAQEAADLIGEGNSLFARGDFSGARTAFEKLIAHGSASADVLYNAGTSALAEGDLGHAVLYLERARKIQGSTEDGEANLAIARSRQADQLGVSPLASWYRWAGVIPENTSALLFSSLWAAGFVALFTAKWAGGRLLKPVRSFGLLLLLGSVPFGLATGLSASLGSAVKEGVVTAQVLPVREFPTPSALSRVEVHSGLKVKRMEEKGDFIQVRLPNGVTGWVNRQGVTDL